MTDLATDVLVVGGGPAATWAALAAARAGAGRTPGALRAIGPPLVPTAPPITS
ncbi:hypothetical protein ACFWG6_13715 [Streptomyces erythrochromogenes]|uniref:hypothetical protein n=1 Tax=Streptomyces erythrochromogenes TaxID=285574 RepID=UPI00364478DD